MKTLEYYFSDGRYKRFDNYTIDQNGVITNINTGNYISRYGKEYNMVTVTDNDGVQCGVRIARAIASTFIGEIPTIHHTADHIDQVSTNDILSNIRWADKREQNDNRSTPIIKKSAFIIIKDGVEKTANDWVDALKDKLNHLGRPYTKSSILCYAQKQHCGFRYKTFDDLPGELWKVIEESKSKMGRWYVSSEGRMKYKTRNAENVMSVDKLHNDNGYPTVRFSNKKWYCHVISFKTFYPEKFSAKKDDDMVLHVEDNKLDFRPSMLYLGKHSQNRFDAYDNGSRDNTKTDA